MTDDALHNSPLTERPRDTPESALAANWLDTILLRYANRHRRIDEQA